jgi:MAPEG family protein
MTLLICIARLAKHRFFTPEDINGSALTAGTERARFLQALVQNTLEQSCLAVPVYIATSIVAPDFLLPLVPAAALMFLVGRLAFFAGYAKARLTSPRTKTGQATGSARENDTRAQ